MFSRERGGPSNKRPRIVNLSTDDDDDLFFGENMDAIEQICTQAENEAEEEKQSQTLQDNNKSYFDENFDNEFFDENIAEIELLCTQVEKEDEEERNANSLKDSSSSPQVVNCLSRRSVMLVCWLPSYFCFRGSCVNNIVGI